MPGRDAQPVAITIIGAGRGATLAFSLDGRLRVAVIVKATFALADGLPMISAEPQAIAERDVHPEGDASRSLLVASDLVPYRAKADVTLTGSACAPAGAPASRVSVRIMLGRGPKTLLDKRIVAQGPLGPGGAAAGPMPFASTPLLWELATKGPSNPAGTPTEGWPRICDAWSRPGPVGVGPIPAAWPTRRAFGVTPTIEGGVMRLPSQVHVYDHVHQGFPWDYFQCAPPDQRVEYLQGDEWLVLEGLHADKPRLQSALPNARVAARVTGDPKNPIGEGVQLFADTLHVDADNRLASVVWRGSFAAESEAALPRYAVFAKLLSDAALRPSATGAAPKSAAPKSSGPRSKRKYERLEMKLSETLAPETQPPVTKSASQTLVGAMLTAPQAAMPFEGAAKPPSVAPPAAPDLSATPFRSKSPLETTLPAAARFAQGMVLPFTEPAGSVAQGAHPPVGDGPPAVPPSHLPKPEAVVVDVPTRPKKAASVHSTMSFDPSTLEKLARTNSPMPFAAVKPSDVDASVSRNDQSRSPSPLPFVAARPLSSPPPDSFPPSTAPAPVVAAPPMVTTSPRVAAPPMVSASPAVAKPAMIAPPYVPASTTPAPPIVRPPASTTPAPPVLEAPPMTSGQPSFVDAQTVDDVAPSTKPVIAPPDAVTPFAVPQAAQPDVAETSAPKEAPKLGAAFLAAMARSGKRPARPLQRR